MNYVNHSVIPHSLSEPGALAPLGVNAVMTPSSKIEYFFLEEADLFMCEAKADNSRSGGTAGFHLSFLVSPD